MPNVYPNLILNVSFFRNGGSPLQHVTAFLMLRDMRKKSIHMSHETSPYLAVQIISSS
jgi:hypothetical protein